MVEGWVVGLVGMQNARTFFHTYSFSFSYAEDKIELGSKRPKARRYPHTYAWRTTSTDRGQVSSLSVTTSKSNLQ